MVTKKKPIKYKSEEDDQHSDTNLVILENAEPKSLKKKFRRSKRYGSFSYESKASQNAEVKPVRSAKRSRKKMKSKKVGTEEKVKKKPKRRRKVYAEIAAPKSKISKKKKKDKNGSKKRQKRSRNKIPVIII